MNRYSGLNAIYLSFFYGDMYVDAVRGWKGLAYQYLFVLVAITWIFTGIKMHQMIGQAVNTSVYPAIEQLPKITIAKGELSIDKPTPYYLRAEGNVFLSFDTAQGAPSPGVNAPVVVTANKVIHTDYKGRKSETPVPDVDVKIEPPVLKKFFESVERWGALIMVLIMIPIAFIFCVLQTLIYAAVGTLFAGTMHARLTYGELIRISVMALTPVLVIDTLLKVSDQKFPLWVVFSIIVALAYIFFGVYANAHPKAVQAPQPAPAEPPAS
ncbi:MAG TPA: DUF1189 family protein [Candidatus Obscuribacterales bacterium]